jgi:hypothetical protein
MRLVDHITLNINNTSTSTVFLDIEKAFYTTWHSCLLYKLLELEFSTSVTNRKFEDLVEGKLSTSRKIEAGVPRGSALAPVLHSLYMNNAFTSPEIHFALF